MSLRTAALALFACALPARAMDFPERAWPVTMTMHFQVHHKTVHMPGTFLLDIEHAHRDISRELWFMAQGMQSEKIDLYLYPDRDSYLKGSFHPPQWSAGRSESQGYPNPKKIFVTYEGVRRELVTHELTHLFFAAYWNKPDNSSPPLWLNEGLATMMEGRKTPITSPIPLRKFLDSAPMSDDPESRVNDWYAQAASIVTFLRKGKSAFHFQSWCKALRDGEKLPDDLRHAYGFTSLEEFDRAWKHWAGISLEREVRPTDVSK